MLSRSRLVSLTGVGGVGKTRLALKVAAASRRAFRDGLYLVDLARVDDGELIAQTVATALGLQSRSAESLPAHLANHLADRRLLIVMDNCEHLLEACAVFVDQMLKSAPGLHFLVTSRTVLGIDGEQVFPVAPLSAPDPGQELSTAAPDQAAPDQAAPDQAAANQAAVSLAAVNQYEAVALLADRAKAVSPGFSVTEDNARLVATLCARLDGIPLAIELAAARLRSLSLGQLVEQLDDRFGLLTSGRRNAPPRQQTLRGMIDWSHGLCSAEERLLWARLSVFPGDFDLDAAEGTCAGDDLPLDDIVDLIDALVSQSILVRTEHDDGLRMRMLETIRQYGRDRLAESGEADQVQRRHCDFHLDLAERHLRQWCGPGQEAAMARWRADHENLRAALEWSSAEPDRAQRALALGAALRYHWCIGGYLGEGRRWLDQALAVGHDATPARTGALWVAAWVSVLQGDHAAAAQRIRECAGLAARTGDTAAQAQLMTLLGNDALAQGQLRDAVSWSRQAVAAHRRTGDTDGLLLSMFILARALSHLGDGEHAAATAEEALAVSRECGEHCRRSYLLWSLGYDMWRLGDLPAADDLTRQALSIQQGFNDGVGAAMAIELLAWIAASQGRFGEAARLIGAANAVWRRTGTTIGAFEPLADCHVTCEEQAIGALGQVDYQAALAESVGSDIQEAIGHALRTENVPGAFTT
ncbi:ATP-binding protein [Nonomuraea lactucae]|uniref:ATP-binding protein n=1 Tax=Nonomuraea lactucae TaxID=2249762 RepID=UPI0013B43899|nr:tetratricopeptide repeat protein [Nonomuraea lactucae]